MGGVALTNERWFAPAPSETSSSRLSLDFGLRSADLYFRELVVPGLGRVWFVRQLSWPLAATVLHEDLVRQGIVAPKPTAICHGIEALACKLEYAETGGEDTQRIIGRRAFGRDADDEIWTFQRLRQPINYVRNTHRQAATRAIGRREGLAFASGSRFDLLELDPVGRALGKALLDQRVGKGGTSLANWLRAWLQGTVNVADAFASLRRALSPDLPSPEEQSLVRSRLLESATSGATTRKNLERAIGRGDLVPDAHDVVVPHLRAAGHGTQADQVTAALAFGAMLDRARDAAADLTKAVESGRGVRVATLARDAVVRKGIVDLRTTAKTFNAKATTASITEGTSIAFAKALVAADDEDAIRLLVGRASAVLGLADTVVTRGPMWRVIERSGAPSDNQDDTTSIEPDRTGRTFRIANLHSVLRDTRPRKAGA